MAQQSTIHKAELQIADLDRGYYATHALTLARHPSETDERMMVRLLAFALHASEELTMGRGLSEPGEPDLAERDLTGVMRLWVEVGLPDDRAVLKACGVADRVAVIAYGPKAGLWWRGIEAKVARAQRLSVISLSADETRELGALAQRNMKLHCTIQEGQILLGRDALTVQVTPTALR